jgi:uncharacterized membrane protein (UPF0127 family)
MMDKVIFSDYALPALVALTEEEQRKGLMSRSWPPPVMVFPYQKEARRKFWMHNTICPLDIVFCRAGYVVDVIPGVPLSLDHVGPDVPCDLVVELPRGMASKLNIVPGVKTKVIYGLSTLSKKYQITLINNY